MALCIFLAAWTSTANQPSFAAETARVSVSSAGVQSDNESGTAAISANGRFVAFVSESGTLVTGDTNGKGDIFVHDRLTKTTARASLGPAGVQANDNSFFPAISADGRFVAFISTASNLVTGDTNQQDDVFVHDLQTKITSRVSIGPANAQGNGSNSQPAISSDGRFVAFISSATNLITGDINKKSDIFVYDRGTKTTTRISVNSTGIEANGDNYNPVISANGRFVAFTSEASNLVTGDTNAVHDVFIYDSQTKQTSRVSVGTGAIQANSVSLTPSLSADGRFVAFMSAASNLVAGDTNNDFDIFVHDRQTAQTSRVSVSTAGVEGNKESEFPAISADGRYVGFDSLASNLVAGDTGFGDIFIHDRALKQTTRASVGPANIQGDYHSANTKISADGRYLAFYSAASNLVAGDSNKMDDIFTYDRHLTNNFKSDLNLASTQQPASITINGQGSFVYTITNNGPTALPLVRIQHLQSIGQLISLVAQTGTCLTYTTISLCEVKNMAVGASVTLTATIKAPASLNTIRQQVSVATNGYADPNMANNYLDIATTVVP